MKNLSALSPAKKFAASFALIILAVFLVWGVVIPQLMMAKFAETKASASASIPAKSVIVEGSAGVNIPSTVPVRVEGSAGVNLPADAQPLEAPMVRPELSSEGFIATEPVTVIGGSASMDLASPAPVATSVPTVAPAPVVQTKSIVVAPAPVASPVPSAPVASPVATASPAPVATSEAVVEASAAVAPVASPAPVRMVTTSVTCPEGINAMTDPTNGTCVLVVGSNLGTFPPAGTVRTVWMCPSTINPLNDPLNGACSVQIFKGVK